ncbi:unnamed protein product [Cochlearia groenlandica]
MRLFFSSSLFSLFFLSYESIPLRIFGDNPPEKERNREPRWLLPESLVIEAQAKLTRTKSSLLRSPSTTVRS